MRFYIKHARQDKYVQKIGPSSVSKRDVYWCHDISSALIICDEKALELEMIWLRDAWDIDTVAIGLLS